MWSGLKYSGLLRSVLAHTLEPPIPNPGYRPGMDRARVKARAREVKVWVRETRT